MNTDFPSAAARHLRAAEANLVSCPDTAGYLLGYVAECSVKAVIQIAGLQIRRHLDQLSPKHLILAADLSLAARRYPIDLDEDLSSFRTNWSTSLRYTSTGTLPPAQVRAFYDQAERLFKKTIHAMVLDGLLDRAPR